MSAAVAADPFAFLKSSSPPPDLAESVASSPAAATVEPPPASPPPAATATTKTRGSKLPLYVDIETIPDESREELFAADIPAVPEPIVYAAENEGPAPSELIKETVEEVKAAIAKAQAGGKKLPRVILESAVVVEQKRPKPRKGVVDLFADMISAIDNEAAMIAAAVDARRKVMSLTPEMARIVAIGLAIGSEPAMSYVVGQPKAGGNGVITEEMILAKFWEMVGRTAGPIVGFNVLGFDLPTIFVRSILLGVDPAKKLDMKPWGADVVDLMKARFPASQAKPLKSLAAWMGIPIPAEGVDGSQVAALFKNDPVRLGDYVRSDISITRELHRKYKGFFTA